MQVSRGLVAIALLFSGLSFAVGQSNLVQVRGAASMVFVGQKLSAFYASEAPGLPIEINVASSTQTLPAGTGSIWQHVGPISGAEKKSLHDKFGSTAQEIPIGIEGVLVIVNKANPVKDLTLEQLRDIYTGKITNWKEAGGPDQRIQLYSTESPVGGSMFFQDFVLHGEDIDTTMRGYANAKETAIAVAADPGGIGLTPVAGDASVKYPRIRRTAASPGVDGTSETVRSLTYPLTSYLLWSFAKDYSPAVEHLVEFALSARGQMAIEASGCYPLNPNERLLGQMALAKMK